MVELLADRIIERGDGAHALRHRRNALGRQRQPVAQRVAQPRGALVGEVGGVRLEDRVGPLVEQARGRRQRRVLVAVDALANVRAARFAATALSGMVLVATAIPKG
jgi:hypothetical protein